MRSNKVPTHLPNLDGEFSCEARHAQAAHYSEVTKPFYDLPVNSRSAPPKVKVVDDVEQFLSACIVRSRKNLTNNYVNLANQFSLTPATRWFVLVAAIEDYLLPSPFVLSHFSCSIMPPQAMITRDKAVAVEADDGKVSDVAVTRVFINVMNLDVLPWGVADTASMIIPVQDLVRHISGNRGAEVFSLA